MKRWLFLIAALLLLCGCAAEPEETAPTNPLPTEASVVHATEPTGYYDPNSPLEAATEGAIQAYPLNRTDSYAAVTLAEDILLLSGQEVTTLTRLTGDNLYVSAAANLDCHIPADSPAFHAGPKGVTYYDELHRQLVYLDTGLKEVSRFSLPESTVGAPALTEDRKILYYCTEDSIRAIDLETGLDKLLRQTGSNPHSILALHYGGTILECRSGGSGDAETIFISAETGKTLYETSKDIALWTLEENFFAIHREGEYPEKLSGNPDSGTKLLITPEYHTPTEAVLALDSAVQSALRGNETELNLYNLSTGIRSHRVRLPGTQTPWNMLADASGNCIWFLRQDADTGSDILCRWNLSRTPSGDETVYTMPRPTALNPDLAGIESLKQETAALKSKYGIEVLLWTDATSKIPGNYKVEEEYQVPLLKRYLKILDQALAVYPEGFLKDAKSGANVYIGLVRSISAAVTSADEPGLSSGFQFRDQNENVYIMLSIGEDTVSTLYNDLALVIDNQVIISCSDFDGWEDLNPKDFEYSFSYRIASGLDDTLFQGENRAFLDAASTTFPREDRARIMAAAMTEGNEELFQSKIMQQKLRTLCLGIRKTFGLRKSSEVFLWEQYLEKPLAHK